ncbi:MAG: endolytic transglycosylase MltG [Streptococcus orisratti]|uniref:endolytic transglycosylase MltG n=1 Tax=Streptococcus orisratti TaxID=114652 RepID=UPI002A919516|nr:endolytic transglycosylase MltG [Streptococcus orisratti]MDY5635301.1 endolytic transglycosylase MltG [Streptococcus orisratti]
MTDFEKDKDTSQETKSFKEQILEEIKEANRLRQLREEEMFRKEQEAKEIAQKSLEQQEKVTQQNKDADLIAEKIRLAEEAQRALEENQLHLTSERQKVDEALESLEQAFTLPHSKIVEPTETILDEQVGQVKDEPRYQPDNEKELVQSVTTKSVPVEQSTIPEEPVRPSKIRRKRQRTDSLAKRIASAIISIAVILILVGGFFTYRYVTSAVGPLDKSSSKYITVEIPEGSGNKYIGQILEKAGVIKDATIFNFYTKFKNYTNFGSGYYNLKASMDLDEISKLLQKGGTVEPERPALGKILITEGYTINQIADAVTVNTIAQKSEKTSTPFSKDDFLKLIQDETFIAKMVAKYPNLFASLPNADQVTYRLEGYLFPATYNYYEDTTLEDLVEQMISTTDSYLSSYYDTIASKGMTVNEVLTLASLVEKEGSTDEDRRNIASVFYNRLNASMPLQSNIAILYAMGKLGEKTSLAEDATIDTTIDSPYNIYTNTGLMPGPVDSPSLSAIEATINPASTDYLYFVADVKTGAVYYSETFEEHQANVEKYINSQLNQ